MTSASPARPAPRPATRAAWPSVGDTDVSVRIESGTGSEPYCNTMASAFACPWVNCPEISTVPWNDVGDEAVGWMMGADCTMPSRSSATNWWKYELAIWSHFAEPDEVSVQSTTHCPTAFWLALAVAMA